MSRKHKKPKPLHLGIGHFYFIGYQYPRERKLYPGYKTICSHTDEITQQEFEEISSIYKIDYANLVGSMFLVYK